MALTDAAIRTAKPAAKSIRLSDEKGLYLLVIPADGYRFDGKRKTLSNGRLS